MTNNNLFERRLDEVEDVTGSGTAMVSLYISAGSSIPSERQRMSQEKSEASNIKDKQNRKNVEQAIEKVNDILKRYKQTPENGLVLFVGVTEEEGTVDFVFDNLQQPLEYSDYTCDSKFRTEPLREMIAPDHTIGLVVVERGGSAIGEMRGTSITVHYDEESNVMGKHNAGGQCIAPDTMIPMGDGRSKRIEDLQVGDEILGLNNDNRDIVESTVRNRWESEKQTYTIETKNPSLDIELSGDHTVFVVGDSGIEEKYASELMEEDALVSARGSEIRGVLEPNIENFYEEDITSASISEIETNSDRKKLIDIETSTGNFFANGLLVHNSAERFDRLIEEQKDNYFDSVRKKLEDLFIDDNNQPTVDGIVIGGTQVTVDNFVSDGYLPPALKSVRIGGSYAIDIANSESLEKLADKARDEIQSVAEQEEREVMNKFFESLHHNSDGEATYGEDMVQKALDYGAVKKVLLSENVEREKINEYEEMAENQGGELLVVSDDFSEGQQFWEGFNGIGAILRYQID